MIYNVNNREYEMSMITIKFKVNDMFHLEVNKHYELQTIGLRIMVTHFSSYSQKNIFFWTFCLGFFIPMDIFPQNIQFWKCSTSNNTCLTFTLLFTLVGTTYNMHQQCRLDT